MQILTAKGVVSAADITGHIEELESYGSRGLGPRVVAKAWVDPAFKKRLLEDGVAGVTELGISAEGWLPKGGVTGQYLPFAVALLPFTVALSPLVLLPFPPSAVALPPVAVPFLLLLLPFPPFAVALAPLTDALFPLLTSYLNLMGGSSLLSLYMLALCMLLYSLRLSLGLLCAQVPCIPL